jgi:hypothetical protein
MNLVRGQQANAGVMVLVVVPVEESPAEEPYIRDA